MKTFSIPFYKDMEFAFTTDTYAINGNTCIGIWCKEGDYRTFRQSDRQPGSAAYKKYCFYRREQSR